MRNKYTFTRAICAAALLGGITAPCLHGQESSYPVNFKIRGGLTAGDIQKYHFDNKIMSFGLEVKRNLFGPGSAVAAELAFEYVPGRHHDIMVPGELVNGVFGGSRPALDPFWSHDDRKEWGQGWTFRASYISQMPSFGPEIISDITRKIEWFAGLGIDRYRVSSEFSWVLRDSTGRPANQTTPVPPYLNNQGVQYNNTNFDTAFGNFGASAKFTEYGADITIGVFGGLKYRISNDYAFEVSVRNFGMKHYDCTPGAYLNFPIAPAGTYVGRDAGKLEVGSARGWALEFAVAMKL